MEHHDDLAGHYHDVLGAIATPDSVYAGDGGEFLAAAAQAGGRWLVVAYREVSAEDGFVITAFSRAGLDRSKEGEGYGREGSR